MLRMLHATVLLLLCASAGGCAIDGFGWTQVQADPFSLRVEYPAGRFPGGVESRGRDQVQWMFGPYPDGSSLMLQASRSPARHDPYEAACTVDCPGETFHLKRPSVGVSTGRIGDRIYYSRCVRSGKEMHCLHLIYPESEKNVFVAILGRMSGTLR